MRTIKTWLTTVAALLCSITTNAVTYSDWASTNQGQSSSISSNSYTIIANAGDVLTFDWLVSSESNYDKLIITIAGPEILNKSGELSGTYQHTFTSSGTFPMEVKYTKDVSVDMGSDYAKVYNIALNVASENIVASGTCGDNITWKFQNYGTLTIEGTGRMTSSPWIDNYGSEIKTVIIDEGITSIGDYAFYDCSSLTTVSLPESVTSIGEGVFLYCSNLTAITIPEGVTSIGDEAFAGCSSLTATTIPEGVTSIGEYAFCDCSSLTAITIPEGVTSIGDYAFYDCSSLKLLVCLALTPPDLGDYVFDGEQGEIEPMLSVPMESLTDYRDADGWRYLPCTNTMILYISTSRGSWAIEKGGDRLKSNRDINAQATAEDSQQQFAIISHIDEDGEVSYYLYHPAEKKFVNKDGSLSDTPTYPIYFKAGAYENTLVAYFDESHYININGERQMVINSWDDADAGNSCTIVAVEEYDLTEALDLFPFVLDGCSYGKTSADEVKLVSASQALNKLEIPATIMFKGKNYSVTSIGDYAFESCSSLTSVIIPESVTSIGDYAFEGCSSLTSAIISEGVKTIGSWAFRDCSSLTSITIPESVTNIGEGVFQRCSILASLVVKEGNTTYDSRDNCNAIIETNSNMLIYGCSSTVIPPSVTSIRGWAFSGCCNLTSITIPKSVTSIGDAVFQHCSNLTTITLPEGVTSIGYDAFSGCSSLTSATIPESVTSIGRCAFSGCSNLTTITLPEGVTSIGYDAFYGTEWYNNQPDGAVYIGKVLYKYKGTMPENTAIEVKEGTVSISPSAFSGYSNLTTITLPEGVTSIGDDAFYGCSSLTAITLPKGVTSIGESAFRDCSSLTAITIPEGVKSIRWEAFRGCSSLTAITIPEGVTSIGDLAFHGCSRLTAITIPEGVTSIEGDAFRNCNSLTSITIPKSVTRIGYYAFYGCTSLHKVLNFSNLVFLKGSSGNGYIAYYAKEVINGVLVGDYVFQITDGTNYLRDYIGVDTELSLPENYNGDDYEIAADLFRGKSTITSVYIPEGVTSIGSNAFSGCSGLKSLFVGTNVDTYGENVFEGCTAVEELTVMGSVMPMVPSDKFTTIRMFSPGPLDVEEFDAKVYRTATLYVPKGSLARYQVADVWKKFWNIKEFNPNGGLNITIGQYGTRTFCPAYTLDFSEVEGLKAYVATGYNTATGEVTLTRVMTAKPGEGVFLKGKPGDYEVPTLKNPESCMQNLLVGTLRNTIVNATSDDGLSVNYEYTAKGEDTVPLFYRINDNVTLEAGKAYLQLPKAWIGTGATRAIGLRFDDEEMEFGDEEQPADVAAPAVIYDLQGRRVANPTKGVFIVNGKKVVFK